MSRFSIILGALFVAIVLAGAGCSGQGNNQSTARAIPLQQNLYAQFEQQARALASAATTQRSALMPPNHDAVSFIHPHEPLEFWIYLAILRDEQGQRYALQQRFARLGLTNSITANAQLEGESPWSYTHIVAIDAQFDNLTSEGTQVHSLAQREALELAGADVTDQRVWIGAFESKNHSASICQPSIRLDSPQVNLRFGGGNSASATCDESGTALVTQTSGFSFLRSLAMPVNGSMKQGLQTTKLRGYGWFMQGWGIPPDSSSAAVVFDRAWLLMDNELSIQLQRSRRASGRGPSLTTGHANKLNSAENTGITPLDSETVLADAEQKTGDNVPVSWQLNSQGNALALILNPVSTEYARARLPGQPWFGVVAIDGSHQGYGFVDFPLR